MWFIHEFTKQTIEASEQMLCHDLSCSCAREWRQLCRWTGTKWYSLGHLPPDDVLQMPPSVFCFCAKVNFLHIFIHFLRLYTFCRSTDSPSSWLINSITFKPHIRRTLWPTAFNLRSPDSAAISVDDESTTLLISFYFINENRKAKCVDLSEEGISFIFYRWTFWTFSIAVDHM